MLETLILWIQIILCCVGIWATHYIFKLINHGNVWWVMSLGFIMLLIANLFTLFSSHEAWYLAVRTVWLPFVIRIAFVFSALRILRASEKEHKARIDAEKMAETNFKKLRELTKKLKFTTDVK